MVYAELGRNDGFRTLDVVVILP